MQIIIALMVLVINIISAFVWMIICAIKTIICIPYIVFLMMKQQRKS